MIKIKCTSLEINQSQLERLVAEGADIECTGITIIGDEPAPEPTGIYIVLDKQDYEELWSCGTVIVKNVNGTEITIIHEDYHGG